MEGLDNMHPIRELWCLYLNCPKKNLMVAQGTSIQESKYAKCKEHDKVQFSCVYLARIFDGKKTLLCSQFIEAI